MLAFIIALFFLIITPGPGVLTTAGVGSAYGYGPGLRFLCGLFVGSNLVAVGIVSGLAAVVLANENIKFALFVASTCYLLYLAARIAFSGAKIAFIKKAKPPGFWGAVVLQILNPKSYVVYTTLFAGFPFMAEAPFTEILVKFAIVNAMWIPVHLLWLWAGVSLHRLDLAPRVQFRINIAMALAMLVVVVLAFFATK